MISLKIAYGANILVAGWICGFALFYPRVAVISVFDNKFTYSEAIRLVGSFWLAVCILSIMGLWYPQKMQWVFVFQIIYKSAWLLFAALPASLKNEPFPKNMGVFFIVWVCVLPFIVDWTTLFKHA